MSNLYYEAGPTASGQKVMLATTSYGNPDASYTFSIARSREALAAAGIQTAYLILQGNCHVDDARNSVVRYFLDSDCDDLVFIDADVSWEPGALVTLCRMDRDLVGGVYPWRRSNGGKGGMPVRFKSGVTGPDDDGCLEVEGLPTGFLRVRRVVIDRMVKDAKSFNKDGKQIPLLFERSILNSERLGGDIGFSMKWGALGGKVYAAYNLRLGHSGWQVIWDSLAANLRRKAMATLHYVVGEIREERDTLDTFTEAFVHLNNPWGAPPEILQVCVMLARKAKGPVLEMGSGLTTIIMAAATKNTVWCVEHDPVHAAKVEAMAREAGVKNIAVVTADLKDDWYDLVDVMDELPKAFSVALVDGPPRYLSDRFKFFDVFGDHCDLVITDDVDDPDYLARIVGWAKARGRDTEIDNRMAVILPIASRMTREAA